MHNNQYNKVLFYSQFHDVDELAISIMVNNFSNCSVSTDLDEICLALNTLHSKVLLISCEQLKHSIYLYDQLLTKLNDHQLLNHKIVFLVQKKEEAKAHAAYLSGMADDYLVSKPIFEKHRLISIVRHLFVELGEVQYATFSAYQPQDKLVGYNRKKQAANAFNKMMLQISDQVIALKQDVEQGSFEIEQVKSNFLLLNKMLHQHQADEQKTGQLRLILDLISLTETCLTQLSDYMNHDSSPKLDKRVYKILLVEDDPWSAKLVMNILRHGPFELDQVADGRSAIQRVQAILYDIILMDVGLPDSDGAALISQLRNNPGENATTPVIMLTGSSDQYTIKRCAANKIQGYLIKPISKDSLLGKLSGVLGESYAF